MMSDGRTYSVPYICPLPDDVPPPEPWRFADCLVRTRSGEPRKMLTSVIRLPTGKNLVLFELQLRRFMRRGSS